MKITKKKLLCAAVSACLTIGAVSAAGAVFADETPVTIAVEDVKTVQFEDVKNTDDFYQAVSYLYDRGVMNGVSDKIFAPDDTLTRAMLVATLYRLEGTPAFMNDLVFEDVEKDSYYEKAVIWANGKGIVKGASDTEFAPNDNITREQLAAIIYRYAQYKEIDLDKLSEDTNTLSYDDIFDTEDYAKTAMHCCLACEILGEREPGKVMPLADATRAEAAEALYKIDSIANSGKSAEIPNPIQDTEKSAFEEKIGIKFNVPKDAKNVKYSIIADEMGQMSFDIDDVSYNARVVPADEFTDISGMYINWDGENDIKFGSIVGKLLNGKNEGKQVACGLLYDTVSGIMYSVTAEADDLTGVNFTDIALEMYVPMQGDAE